MGSLVWQLSHCTLWFVNTISGTTRVCLIRTGSVVQGSRSSKTLFYIVVRSFSPFTAAHALLRSVITQLSLVTDQKLNTNMQTNV